VHKQVVVVQRRDPVLVTSCGPDRVLMQCFPVPRDGGTVKVPLGITAPLLAVDEQESIVYWPYFLERNFAARGDFKHSVWVESPQELRSAHAKLDTAQRNGRSGIHGQLAEEDLQSGRVAVRARRTTTGTTFWAPDYGSSDGGIIQQRIESRLEKAPSHLILLVDGSVSMRDWTEELADSLSGLPQKMEVSMLAAMDGVVELSKNVRVNGNTTESLAKSLCAFRPVGGQDNLAALVRAWDLAAGSADSAILWVHGPQPVVLDSVETLRQRFLWTASPGPHGQPHNYDYQVKPGPHRLVEMFDKTSCLVAVQSTGDLKADLSKLFALWKGEQKQTHLVYERVGGTTGEGTKTSKHLVRLWAFSEILRHCMAGDTAKAVEMAGRYQLVTPVSGAVVLETAQQFAQAGLSPADASTVPMVPEPAGLFALGLLAVAFLVWRQKRARRLQRQ
jgi:hypothetical protein